MATTLDELERRVTVLEAQMRVNDADHAVINEKLNTLIGGQDLLRDTLRDQGRLLGTHSEVLAHHSEVLAHHSELLAEHSAKLVEHDARFDAIDAKLVEHDTRFDQVDGKLDIVLAWIETQP